MSEVSSLQQPSGLVLPVEIPPIKQAVKNHAASRGFHLKGEFHVTIVSREAMAKIDPNRANQLRRLLAQASVFDMEYHDVLYRAQKPKVESDETWERESLLALVESETIVRWVGAAATEVDLDLAEPFLHVTLFTKPDTAIAREGIGIYTPQDWLNVRPQPYMLGWMER